MKSILFSIFLFAFASTYAQQITIDTSLTSDEPGVIERYWHWAAGVNVVGTGFTPSSEITIVSKDSNGFAWREFTTTSDTNGGFALYVNAMKLNSIMGTYTATATDASNLEAYATYNVIANLNDVLDATVSQSQITMNDFHYGSGVVISASGFAPNALVKINLGTPSAGGTEITPMEEKYADANGVYTMTIDGTTQVGVGNGPTNPIPQIPGIWGVTFHDFSGTGYIGSTTFRILPDNPGEYCIPEIAFEVEPITKVEFSNISKTSSLTSTEGYEDFTEEIANVNAGETYTIKLQGKAKWNWNVNTYTVFIDWNQNGIMDEEGEVYSAGYLLGSTGEDGQTVEYDITIPENAVNGETRMRVLKVYSPSSTAMFWPDGACGDYNYGQIEDYTVNISGGTDPVVCTINCPENIIVQVEAGATGYNVEYTVNYECDGESEGLEVVRTSGPASGTEFPIGTTTVSHNLVKDGILIDSCTFTVTVEEKLGVSDLNDVEITHYPNPVKEVLNIVDTKEISNIAIFDLSGKLVYTQVVNNKQTQINVSNLSKGIYIVKVNVNDDVKTFKILKK